MGDSIDDADCPVCGGERTMKKYWDSDGIDNYSGECLRCGFAYSMNYHFLSGEDLEERRGDFEYEGGKVEYSDKEKKEILKNY